MIFRKRQAFILAIHGCQKWPSVGFDFAGQEHNNYCDTYFPNHYLDGGSIIPGLSNVPQITQVLDATGGIGRVNDVSFDITDTRDQSFAKFFAASKLSNTYGTLAESMSYTDTTAVVTDTSMFQDGDRICLPRETIYVSSIETETEMFVSRSLYSCFSEGRWATYNAVTPNPDGGGVGPDLVHGGHWNHSGRWICLYVAESDSTGTLGDPRRIYAGVIDEVSFDGMKITLSTRSVTSLLQSNIIQDTAFQIGNSGFYCPADMELHSVSVNDVTKIANLTSWNTYTSIFAELESTADTLAQTAGTNFHYTLKPTHMEIAEGQSGVVPVIGYDNPSFDNSHPALIEYLRLRQDPYVADTGSQTIMYCSEDNTDESLYDYIIVPGGRFIFANDAYLSFPYSDYTQYFLFNNGTRKIAAPCTWSGTYWEFVDNDTVYPWMQEDGTQLAPNDRYLCLNRSTTTVRSIVSYPAWPYVDLVTLAHQILISTGESVNTYETGALHWFNAYGLPSYLVDSPSFQDINYLIKPTIESNASFVELFENCLKVAGYSIVLSSEGKLKLKQNSVASRNYSSGTYELSQVATNKPNTAIGYHAPLTSIVVKLTRLNKTYTFTMCQPQSAFSKKNELSLEDSIMIDQYEYIAPVAYANLYWLANTIPSTQIKCNEIIGEVGDIVELTNKYIPDGTGYGITGRTALQTETTFSPDMCSVRLLLAGNVDLSSFGPLAPAASVDLTVGTYGLDGGKVYLLNDHDSEGQNWPSYVVLTTGETTWDVTFRSALSHFTVLGCTMDSANNAIVMPAGFTWPSGFRANYSEGYIYATIGEYWHLPELE